MKTKNKKEEKENKNLQKLLDNIADGFNSKYSIDLDENSSSFGKVKEKRKNYEAEVVKRKQGIEDARDERELRESQDQMQNSFVSEFESGELVH